MATDHQPRWLATSGPWESLHVWICTDCGEHGDLTAFDDREPRDHVVDTGHTVALSHITEMTVFPVNTQPPG